MQITDIQHHVTQEGGTEAPFTGKYLDCKEEGIYQCICCRTPLFSSEHKYDSGCGWPAFDRSISDSDAVTFHEDNRFGMMRTEVRCKKCGAHLGHVFPDDRQKTGNWFCINSAALDLEKSNKDL